MVISGFHFIEAINCLESAKILLRFFILTLNNLMYKNILPITDKIRPKNISRDYHAQYLSDGKYNGAPG